MGEPDPASAEVSAPAQPEKTEKGTGLSRLQTTVADEDELSPEVYLGVVKSYNDRRGFGFLACAETASLFGRDVYMPKVEATAAAIEAAAADGDEAAVAAHLAFLAAAEKEKEKEKEREKEKENENTKEQGEKDGEKENKEKAEKPPLAPRLAEEDLVRFRVKLSVEGYPQAARVKKLRKFTGVVVRIPAELGADESEGSPGALSCEEATEAHGWAEVPVRRRDCGQVRLAVGDEVTFCVPEAAAVSSSATPEEASGGNEAKLVFLSKTTRSNRSVLGCFTLDLPRTGGGEEAVERPNLQLGCHAFGDKLILAGLPADLEEAELMRFFSKQGASGAIVAHARTCSFASVSFPGTVEVARFIGRTAHAFADEKETRIAKLLHLKPSEDTARLPALPSPSLSHGEEPGSLLVVWSPLVLAMSYTVDLRPAGGTWATVDVAANQPGSNGDRFDSDCSSCKVTGLQVATSYEARVSYYTECGTRSEASEPSPACSPAGGPTPPPAVQAPGVMAGLGAAEGFGAVVSEQPPVPPPPDFAALPPDFAAAAAAGYGAPPGHTPLQTMPPPPAWHSWSVTPDGIPPGMVGPPPPYMPDPFAPPLPAYVMSPGWRSATGLVVPPPAAPELRAADEHGFAVSIQWPAVLQASAYVVELREAGSTQMERFVRAAQEKDQGALVELRVGGLRPGPSAGRVYVAQVRTVGADGSESAPSPPGWSPPLGGTGAAPLVPASGAGTTPGVPAPPSAPAPNVGGVLSADAAPWQPPPYVSSVGAPDPSVPPGTLPVPVVGEAPAAGAPCPQPVPLGPPVAPPPAAPPPPPQPPPPTSSLGSWAPPPWLGQAEPAGAKLGTFSEAMGACAGVGAGAGQGPGAPPAAPPFAPSTVPPTAAPGGLGAAEAVGVPWGAPGAPPPPPAGPPPLLQAGQLSMSEDKGSEAKAQDECLILD